MYIKLGGAHVKLITQRSSIVPPTKALDVYLILLFSDTNLLVY